MANPQQVLNNAKEARMSLNTDKMPVKGSVGGMLGGGLLALFLKRNVITFALIGALLGGAINVLMAKNKSDDEQE